MPFDKKHYGDEYPAAVTFQGVRMPLQKERRFSRHYENVAAKRGFTISRFDDGTATMTLPELRSGWPEWDEKDRSDFCQNCGRLLDQSDYADMLRFIMQHGSHANWSGIALLIAVRLPQEEAFDFLLRAFRVNDDYANTNIAQALAQIKHPGALPVLRQWHQFIWANQEMWDKHPYFNPLAVNAVFSIKHLLELGAPPAEFEEQVRQLSQHVCAQNRKFCYSHLSKYYPWLQAPDKDAANPSTMT